MDTVPMLIWLAIVASTVFAANKIKDEVTSLPGITFEVSFKHYSGYLNATAGNFLHYWLLEAQSQPSQAPLVLWLNGGPGCSSLLGLFAGNGPFRPSRNGETLFENVFAWNKIANMLYLESPCGVGFSYRDNATYGYETMYNDGKTTIDVVLALKDFFNAYPEYDNRDFYIAGESYGGVYVPTLADALLKQIKNGSFPHLSFKGIAIGNGIANVFDDANSGINLLYFRNMIDRYTFTSLYQCCSKVSNKPFVNCPFADFIQIGEFNNRSTRNFPGDPEMNKCSNTVLDLLSNHVWSKINNVYNTYQDCYAESTGTSFAAQSLHGTDLTDALGGFPCYMLDAATKYLTRKEVRAALHIPEIVPDWNKCNNVFLREYRMQHLDTSDLIESIIDNASKNFRILYYNGDADMACNFMGVQWFVDRLAAKNNFTLTSVHTPWNYTRAAGLQPIRAGYSKSFTGKRNFTIHLLTVKGAGHVVPLDRPGPSLQMISNFFNNFDFNIKRNVDVAHQPLLPKYQTPISQQEPIQKEGNASNLPPPANFDDFEQRSPGTRRMADKISNLPALTFNYSAGQYSGYLKAAPGHKFFYWFVEAQSDPNGKPLLLWLNGGPGCSSLLGIFTENGPFRPNPDGQTLSENVHAWNKVANVLYIDSPRQVGFSYQDNDIDDDSTWNDDQTISDLALALTDFFTVYPFYASNEFYVTGESYGGIYVPLLIDYLIKEIQAGTRKMNLKGFAVGNGAWSEIHDTRNNVDFAYFHGAIDTSEYDRIRECCPEGMSDSNGFLFCSYDKWKWPENTSTSDNISPKDFSSACAGLVSSVSYDMILRYFHKQGNNAYNIYQDCYAETEDGNWLTQSQLHPKVTRFFDPISTDALGGFPCYSEAATKNYLSHISARRALHVPDVVQGWTDCSNINYTQQYNRTMEPILMSIIASKYPIRALAYNGDVDSVCTALQAESFFHDLAASASLGMGRLVPWMHREKIAGYVKNFRSEDGLFSIDVLTVKGAGHYAPMDRPGPALQMITKFLANSNYDDRPSSSPHQAAIGAGNLLVLLGVICLNIMMQ